MFWFAMASGALSMGEKAKAESQGKIIQMKRTSDLKAQGRIAGLQADYTAANLKREFNRTMASNAVIAAAQGRSGGSVEQIASAAEAQYNWDADFSQLSAEYQELGINAQIKDSSQAEGQLKENSMFNKALGGVTLASKAYSIRG